MRTQYARPCSRRQFLGGCMLTGVVDLLGLTSEPVAAEPPPETRTLRIGQSPAICFAPQYVAADQLFQAEGFEDVQYVKRPYAFDALISGEADFASSDVGTMLRNIDQGHPIVGLGALAGSWEAPTAPIFR
jgi:NitT/TauT family transport system substrate-binding protein